MNAHQRRIKRRKATRAALETVRAFAAFVAALRKMVAGFAAAVDAPVR